MRFLRCTSFAAALALTSAANLRATQQRELAEAPLNATSLAVANTNTTTTTTTTTNNNNSQTLSLNASSALVAVEDKTTAFASHDWQPEGGAYGQEVNGYDGYDSEEYNGGYDGDYGYDSSYDRKLAEWRGSERKGHGHKHGDKHDGYGHRALSGGEGKEGDGKDSHSHSQGNGKSRHNGYNQGPPKNEHEERRERPHHKAPYGKGGKGHSHNHSYADKASYATRDAAYGHYRGVKAPHTYYGERGPWTQKSGHEKQGYYGGKHGNQGHYRRRA